MATTDDTAGPRTVYDVSHRRAWGPVVSLYLWTKSLAAGPILVSALLMLLGYARAPVLFGVVAPSLALVFTLVTVGFLVADLDRPERFLKVLFHPNWRSWLVWGAWILIAFSGVALFWLLAGLLGLGRLLALLLWPALLLAALAAGYSAFLLAQARARDLWQSRLVFPHLLAQAYAAGSGVLALASLWFDSGAGLTGLLLRGMLAALCVHGLFLLAEFGLPHGNQDAAGAVDYMVHGPLAQQFWFGAVFVGVAIPVHLLAYYFVHPVLGATLPAVAAAAAVAGLLAYEDCFIRAGQALPLS